MGEYGFLAVVAAMIPTGILLSMWRYARRQIPDFRIQFSIFDLWMLALCSSPAFLITAIRFEHVTFDESAGLMMLMILHQTTGAFFMYVLERLTPEAVRSSPMPLVLLAGSLLGWTILPLLTLIVMGIFYSIFAGLF